MREGCQPLQKGPLSMDLPPPLTQSPQLTTSSFSPSWLPRCQAQCHHPPDRPCSLKTSNQVGRKVEVCCWVKRSQEAHTRTTPTSRGPPCPSPPSSESSWYLGQALLCLRVVGRQQTTVFPLARLQPPRGAIGRTSRLGFSPRGCLPLFLMQ